MTANDYQNKGYKISQLVLQAVIDKAEDTAKSAYIYPIISNAQTTDEDVKNAVMAIAYLIMCRNNVFVTRAGAKTKTTLQSEKPYSDSVSDEQVLECGRLLEVLRNKENANRDAKVVDVAKIFFKTNYFYTD